MRTCTHNRAMINNISLPELRKPGIEGALWKDLCSYPPRAEKPILSALLQLTEHARAEVPGMPLFVSLHFVYPTTQYPNHDS